MALLLLREVFNFMGKSKKPDGNKSGDLDPADWEQRVRKIVCDAIEPCEDNVKELKKVTYNTRDIVRDIAKSKGIRVQYSDREHD